MSKTVFCDGNKAVSIALQHVNPDFAATFPITPSTKVAEMLAAMAADGTIDTEVILAPGENDALAICIAASAAGARTVTATNSQGFLYMAQQLWQAAGMRRPIVIADAMREIAAPLNIWGSHSDVMALRDCGWIIRIAKDQQEVYEFMLQAFPTAEHPEVGLPMIVGYDGFTLSHTSAPVTVADRERVQRFVGEFDERYSLLDTERSVMHGSPVLPNCFMEVKRAQHEAMEISARVILEVAERFTSQFWKTQGHVESYCLEDADRAVVIMGGSSGIVRSAVDQLRATGERVGMLRVVTYRPFPTALIREMIGRSDSLQSIAVLDRAVSIGAPAGPLASDVMSALLSGACRSPRLVGCTYGLGGRDLRVVDVKDVFDMLKGSSVVPSIMPHYINVRE